MAGLGAAYQLSKSGHEVSIYEKSSKLGGLAASLQINDVPLENFYHHMFPSYTEFFKVAKEIGVDDKIFFRKAKTANYFQDTLYPFDGAFDLLRFKPLTFIERLRTGVLIAYLKIKRNWKDFENITAAEWLKKYFGVRVYEVLWEPLLKSKFGDSAEEVSMVWFWGRIYERPSSFGYFDGGFEVFVNALQIHLEKKGVKVNTNATVESLEKDNDGSFIVTANDLKNHFDQLIVAAPPAPLAQIAKRILPEDIKKNLENYKYVGTVCAVLVLKKQLSPYYWINIQDHSCPFVVVVEQTNFVPKNTYGGSVPVYLARYIDRESDFYNLPEEEIWNQFLSNIKKINKEFDESWVKEKHLFKAPFTQPVVLPGYETMRPSYHLIDGLWWVSMSHIYPWDRGVHRSFSEGQKLADELMRTTHG